MFKGLALSAGMAALAVPAFADVKTYDFQGFEAIQAQDAVTVKVTTGDAFAVRAQAGASVLDQVTIDVTDGALSISRNAPWGFGRNRTQDAVTIFVTMPSLEWVGASSGADIRVMGGHGQELTIFAASDAMINVSDASYAAIDADVRNGAQVKMSGACGVLQGESHQGATLDAAMLDCARAKTVATSGGVVTLNGTLAQMEDLDLWDEEDGLSEDLFAWDERSVTLTGLLY